jgi:hypothetical protein
MELDFAVGCPLVRRSRLLSGSCPSTRTFDPCFFQTPPRGGGPCIITRPSPPSHWPEDFRLQAAEHAQHTTKPLARRTLRVRRARSVLDDTPYPKAPRRLPQMLSVEEMARVIDAADSLSHRTMPMVLYSTGMRNAELRDLIGARRMCESRAHWSERSPASKRSRLASRDINVISSSAENNHVDPRDCSTCTS